VESTLFHSWKGDLLISSLNAGSLFRVRLRGERAVYVEQIPVGFRIRDLAEGADGRLILWTDIGVVLVIARARGADGAAVFSRCRRCHEGNGDQASQLSLKGVVGRPVAGVDNYAYSEALRHLGGVWTEERLDAFLADPDGYAPGSRMGTGRVPDEEERKALLRFLRNRR
jgi:cytochrome c2